MPSIIERERDRDMPCDPPAKPVPVDPPDGGRGGGSEPGSGDMGPGAPDPHGGGGGINDNI